MDRQSQLVVPLLGPDLVASQHRLNDCDSGGGGSVVVETVPGVTVQDVADRLLEHGWKSKADPQGNPGAVVLSGLVDGEPVKAYVDKRPPENPVTEIALQHDA